MPIQEHRMAVNALFLLNGFAYGNWISRLPGLQEVHSLDNGGIGLVLLAHAIGALIAMPFTGWLIGRNGSRWASIAATWFFLLFVACIPLATNAYFLGLIFFCMGMASGMLDVAMNAQAVLVEKAMKKPIMSSFHAVFSLGMMLGAGCGALFIRLQLDLSAHFWITVGFSLILAWWATRHLIEDRIRDAIAEGGGFQLPNRALIGMGLIAFCCMLGEGAMADWSTNYMENVAMAAPALAPLAIASFSLSMMIARFLGDRARAYWGDRRILIGGSFLAALGLTFCLVILQPVAVILGSLLVGLGLSTIVPIAYSTAGHMPDVDPGVGISMVTTVGYSGFLFGPPIIGFIADGVGLRLALGFVLMLFMFMLILSNRLPRISTS